jgi:iron complex outermembrane recepter protein
MILTSNFFASVTNALGGSKMLLKKLVSMLFLLLTLCFSFVFAESGSGVLIEEITVVAQKREQSLQDVSIAISAFSSSQIKALGFKDSTDIAAMTPGVHISGALGGQLQTFTIRGVAQSDFIETAESPNAIYVDDAYVAYMSAGRFPMFDLERVEVLKGPQGTLFGRNATGGLVHYISKKPTEELDGYLDVTYGS